MKKTVLLSLILILALSACGAAPDETLPEAMPIEEAPEAPVETFTPPNGDSTSPLPAIGTPDLVPTLNIEPIEVQVPSPELIIITIQVTPEELASLDNCMQGGSLKKAKPSQNFGSCFKLATKFFRHLMWNNFQRLKRLGGKEAVTELIQAIKNGAVIAHGLAKNPEAALERLMYWFEYKGQHYVLVFSHATQHSVIPVLTGGRYGDTTEEAVIRLLSNVAKIDPTSAEFSAHVMLTASGAALLKGIAHFGYARIDKADILTDLGGIGNCFDTEWRKIKNQAPSEVTTSSYALSETEVEEMIPIGIALGLGLGTILIFSPIPGDEVYIFALTVAALP